MRLAPAGFDTGEMLVTAGHDMIVRVFDLRSSRTTPHTLHTLTSNSLINCLAICPTNSHQVVLGLDNGSLGWIDWRRGNRLANRKFSAHADAVMSIDWKESLDERGEGRAAGGWIASGGLDKKVHVSHLVPVVPSHAPTEAGTLVAEPALRSGTTQVRVRHSIGRFGPRCQSVRSAGDRVTTPKSPSRPTRPSRPLAHFWTRSRLTRRSRSGTSVAGMWQSSTLR